MADPLPKLDYGVWWEYSPNPVRPAGREGIGQLIKGLACYIPKCVGPKHGAESCLPASVEETAARKPTATVGRDESFPAR